MAMRHEMNQSGPFSNHHINYVTGALATRGIEPCAFFFFRVFSIILLVSCLYKMRHLRLQVVTCVETPLKQHVHSHNYGLKSLCFLFFGGQISRDAAATLFWKASITFDILLENTYNVYNFPAPPTTPPPQTPHTSRARCAT